MAAEAIALAGLRAGKSPREIAVDLYGREQVDADWHADSAMRSDAAAAGAARAGRIGRRRLSNAMTAGEDAEGRTGRGGRAGRTRSPGTGCA